MLKRIVKFLVSLVYFFLRSLVRRVRRIPPDGRKPGCIILYYHQIQPHERAGFLRELQWIRRWSRPISLDRPEDARGSGRTVALTFDDAFQNVVDNALPALEDQGIPATIFVPSGYLGKRADWLRKPSQMIISAETLKSLPPGLFTVGSHTVSHTPLAHLEPEQARKELADSKADLERILGRPVTLLSFPYERYNREILDLCRDTGYERVFTCESYPALRTPEEYVSGRVATTPRDWAWEFKLKLLGAYEWVPLAMRWRRWLR